MKKSIMFLCVVALSACTHYERPGVNSGQLAFDKSQCEYEADKATAAISDPVMAGSQNATIEVRCMNLKGYSLVRN